MVCCRLCSRKCDRDDYMKKEIKHIYFECSKCKIGFKTVRGIRIHSSKMHPKKYNMTQWEADGYCEHGTDSGEFCPQC